MTREEAIYIMMNSNEYHHAKGELPHSALSIEAFNMAIEALKERPHGEWIDVNGDGSIMKCLKCGEEVCCKDNNFCPFCGADMRGDMDG